MTFPTMACPVALEDWQAYFVGPLSYTPGLPGTLGPGITLGPKTNFLVNRISQGWDLAGIASHDEQWPRTQGELIGLDVMKGRTFQLEMWVAPLTGGVTGGQLLYQLASQFTVAGATETPFWYKLPSYPVLGFMVRTRRRSIPLDPNFAAAGLTTPKVELHATDPMGYGPVSVQSVTANESTSSGTTFPATFPLTFTSTQASVNFANEGNWWCYPIFVLSGPLTLPRIGVSGIGGLVLNNGLTPTIAAGQTVVIDTFSHSVTLHGAGITQPVGAWVQPGAVWPTFPPGETSSVVLQVGGGSSGSLTVYAASAYNL